MKKKTSNGKLKLGKNVITSLDEKKQTLVNGGMMAYTKMSVCAEQCCNSNDWYCKTQ